MAIELKHITIPMRDLLIAHLDGSAPVPVNVRSQQHLTVRSAFSHGWITFTPTGGEPPARPQFSYITNAGREVLAAVLADYADVLVRAGFLEAETPITAPLPTDAEQRDEFVRALTREWMLSPKVVAAA